MARTSRPAPSEDAPVSPEGDLTVIQAIRSCFREAEQAAQTRTQKTRQNFQAYLGHQDWRHKQAGQSQEFLPKTSMAVEQFAQFIKRALTQFGAWFSVDVTEDSLLTDQQVHDLLRTYLDDLPGPGSDTVPFELVLSDGMKHGLLGALVILKVHGRHVPDPEFYVEPGQALLTADGGVQVTPDQLQRRERAPWRLCIDLVRPEDYFPDPTGRGLYEIHRVRRDLHEVVELAEQGIYDRDAVAQIESSFRQQEAELARTRMQNQDPTQAPEFRKEVQIDEFWGTLLDARGRVVQRQTLAALANDQFLIRKPEPMPFWHGGSPFVKAPLIRIPGSVWHKALYDDVVPLNFALNELFNLMLDGGLASVWGVRQLRMDYLDDPRQVSGGVPQGITLAVKQEMPAGMKVLENVTEGEVPGDALEMYRTLDREYQAASMMTDLKMGFFPPRAVKATEVLEASQSQAVTLDGMVGDIERSLIVPTLEKAYLNILQHLEVLDARDVVAAIGPQAALQLARMTAPERFAALARKATFQVHGISATLGKVRDFQKTMAFMAAVSQSPVLLQAFQARFSADKMLTSIMKTLNLNPEQLEMTPEERAQAPQRMAQMAALQGILSGAPTAGIAAPVAGDSEVPAEIAQTANPMTGMAGP
jgi:hypothetical protein